MMQKRSPRWGALALAGLALSACTTNPVTPTPDPALPTIRVVTEGRLVPSSFVDLTFSGSGQIAEVLVAEGESVTEGQALARLAPSPDWAAQQARAEQEQLAATQALTTLRANAPLALAQAELAAATTAQTLIQAQERLADLQEVAASNSRNKPTTEELAVAAAQLATAAAQSRSATAHYALLQENAGLDPDLLAAAAARLTSAEVTLESLQAAHDQLTLTAPTAGTVAEVRLKVGERATPGQLAVTIADLDTWVIATDDLTELEVVNVAPGDKVTVTLDALPDLELTGTVERLETRYEEKRGDITYTVYITLAATDPQMRWGMTASVVFEK